MGESIICFTVGLSEEDIKKGKMAFYELNQGKKALEVIPITGGMLAARVGETVDAKAKNEGLNEVVSSVNGAGSPLAIAEYRIVILQAGERNDVIQAMRGFKAVLPDPRDIIFAMITDTARTWTFENYIEHLTREHEYMKTHGPESDPDMKRM